MRTVVETPYFGFSHEGQHLHFAQYFCPSFSFFEFLYKEQQEHFAEGKGEDSCQCARIYVSAFHLYKQWRSDNGDATEIKHTANAERITPIK